MGSKGRQMMRSGHFAASEVEQRLAELQTFWGRLKDAASVRRLRLLDALESHTVSVCSKCDDIYRVTKERDCLCLPISGSTARPLFGSNPGEKASSWGEGRAAVIDETCFNS